MTSATDQEGFEPIHDAHAIEQVAFVVQFDNSIDDTTFDEAKSITDQFNEELPGKRDVARQGFSIPLGKQASPINHPIINTGIIRMSASRDGSIESELRIERSAITFLTTRYTRWKEIWGQASRYFNAVLPLYLENTNLIAVGMNYVDKFVWKGNSENFNPKLLIHENSKYVCKHIFETNDLWHSHTGAFIRIDKITKRLININIDCVNEVNPEGERKVISITTSASDQFNQLGYEPYSADEDSIAMIDEHMQNIHLFGKSILSQLITEHMSKRIALTQSS